ncbi:MAG: hypothetical protein NWE89_13995 [Candidatus Bathyarchaeota archaeon]|nr:hypothetical protein [Candidatus Bathyarchaeota archaeon]
MSKLKTILSAVLVLVVVIIGIGMLSVNQDEVVPDTENQTPGPEPTVTEPEQEPELTYSRVNVIPDDAVKQTPEIDLHPPVLHSFLWEDPVIMPGGINTAGAEDSPFMSPDGESFFFFFTPDVRKPAEMQVLDGYTGIWVSRKVDGVWGEAERLWLIEDGLSLDGCPYVDPEEIWFCSVRNGNLKEIDFWIASLGEDGVYNIRNAGEELNIEIQVGELHITSDYNTIYYHSMREDGVGGMDLWKVDREGDGWGEPVNLVNINSPDHEGYPYVNMEMDELWINKWYMGSPGTFRSKLVDGEWTTPELVVSSFAGEPNLDPDGNIYFVHHYFEDGVMLEADIYVAYRKPQITPVDNIPEPERRYILGVLPSPAEGQSFDDAYAQAAETSELVPVWGRPSPFFEKAEDLEGSWGQTFVEDLTRGNGMAPLLHFSFMGQGVTLSSPPGTSYTLSDLEWRLMYKRAVIESVEATKPAYLSVGNEVNRWYEKYGWDDVNGFKHWVSLYEEIYDEVKELSPETKVFCTFSREIVSELREADMDVLDYFNPEKMDILVMTTYPHSVQGVNRPSDIPEDYYRVAADKMPGKPVGFSELAWPSLTAFGGEDGQAEYLRRMTNELLTGMDIEFLMWPWLHDLNPQDTTGLIGYDGTEKAGYVEWVKISSTG